MRRLLFAIIALLLGICVSGVSFGQKGELAEKEAENLKAEVLIQTFFTKQTGDLPEMLKRHRIRVLVVPSRSTYFLDKKGQPRGIDYELLKGWEKILNKGRKKGTPPITLIFRTPYLWEDYLTPSA